MKTSSVTFDPITDLPRYVDPNHYQSKLDDKSGYDHFLESEDSRTCFGLYWKAFLSVIPFLLVGAQAPMYTTLLVLGLHTSYDLKAFHYPNTLMTTMWLHIPASWSDSELASTGIYI